MKRLSRCTQAFLLLSTLTASLAACDHDRGDPLGPLDLEHHTERVERREVHGYVAPLDLELEWTTSHTAVLAGQSTEILARIQVQAPEALDLPRPPARVVLVVDTSASMKGDAIEGAKAAAMELVDGLAEGDSFALVVFHSRAEVLMPSTVINEDSRAAARSKIETMQAWGTTDLGGGLQQALAQLQVAQNIVGAGGSTGAQNGAPDPTVLERVVLLGDGVPNDASTIPSTVGQLAARGTQITALGYGIEYDETLLASLAEQTHGSFRFVDDPEAVASLFRDEVLDIERTVANDLRLSVGLGPGVQLLEVIGRPAAWAGGSKLEVQLGSLSEGQSHDIMLRLAVGPHSDGATVELSDLELSFADVYTGTGQRFERDFLSVEATADADAVEAGEQVDLLRIGARARTSAATLQVLAQARSGDTKGAKLRLREAVDWALAEAEQLEDAELKAQAEKLAALEGELASLAPRKAPVARSPQPGTGSSAVEQAFAPAPKPSSPRAAQRLREVHSKAYNDIH